MAVPPDSEYWNHNTAYQPWLVDIAAQHRGDVLDVGCGDGLLAARLAPVSRSVTGIDSDPGAAARATARLAPIPHAMASAESFEDFSAGERRFDVITFVASLHHMDLRAALIKARGLLTDDVLPGAHLRRGLYYRYLLRWANRSIHSRT